jgi:hypothetical protein
LSKALWLLQTKGGRGCPGDLLDKNDVSGKGRFVSRDTMEYK